MIIQIAHHPAVSVHVPVHVRDQRDYHFVRYVDPQTGDKYYLTMYGDDNQVVVKYVEATHIRHIAHAPMACPKNWVLV